MPDRPPLPGDPLADFHVLETREIPSLQGHAVLLRHRRLRTRLLHLRTADEENLLAVAFPTPPPDDSGLPHILEHSVLAGSRRFPLKDPFFEMVKTSLATFLNALTSTDFTVYPFSSVVPKDLFNLGRVYLDAVFRPLLTESTFRREGWHHTVDTDGRLGLNGIVYNEMKAAYASPESHLWRAIGLHLLPDSPLRFDAGGWPQAIPLLTYDDFLAYHRDHYTPANAFVFAYGNIPTTTYAEFLSENLRDLPTPPAVPLPLCPTQPRWSQPRWSAPRQASASYPVNPDEPTQARTYLTLSWLVSTIRDPFELVAWQLLFQLLFGHDAAPVRKALLDSRLGTDLAANFLGPIGPELLLSFGLKGSEPDRHRAFQDLVLSTLEHCAEKGFTTEQIRAAGRLLSYRHLERNRNFSLNLLMNTLPLWIHADDPFSPLLYAELLASVTTNAIGSPDLLKSMLRGLLDNPHRLLTILTPDPGLTEEENRATAELLSRRAAELGENGLAEAKRLAAQLEELNSRTDPPELLRILPRLDRTDLPDKPWTIPAETSALDTNTTLSVCRIPTNGVFYAVLAADLSNLPEELLPYLAHLGQLHQKMAVSPWSWAETAERKAAAARTFSCRTSALTPINAPSSARVLLRFAFVTLPETLEEALDLFAGLLERLDLSDSDRLLTVSRQYAARWRDTLLNEPLPLCASHSRRAFAPSAAVQHTLQGLPAFHEALRWEKNFKTVTPSVTAACRTLLDLCLAAPWTAACAGPDKTVARFQDVLRSLSRKRPTPAAATAKTVTPPEPSFEAIELPQQTHHAVIACPGLPYAHPAEPLLQLATNWLSDDLWLQQVRLRNGAYGARVSLDPYDAVWTFSSYADPDFRRTWDLFRRLKDEAASLELSRERLDQLVISTLRNDINPLKPEEAVHAQVSRLLRGEPDDLRLRRYKAILAAEPESVRSTLLAHLETATARAAFCVAAGPEQVAALSTDIPGLVRLTPLATAG